MDLTTGLCKLFIIQVDHRSFGKESLSTIYLLNFCVFTCLPSSHLPHSLEGTNLGKYTKSCGGTLQEILF